MEFVDHDGNHGLRVAVLVNDFDSVNIDTELAPRIVQQTQPFPRLTGSKLQTANATS